MPHHRKFKRMKEIIFIKYLTSLGGKSPPSPMCMLLSLILPNSINHRGFAGLCFLLAAAFLTVFSIKVFQEVEISTVLCEPHTFLKIAACSTLIKKVLLFILPTSH